MSIYREEEIFYFLKQIKRKFVFVFSVLLFVREDAPAPILNLCNTKCSLSIFVCVFVNLCLYMSKILMKFFIDILNKICKLKSSPIKVKRLKSGYAFQLKNCCLLQIDDGFRMENVKRLEIHHLCFEFKSRTVVMFLLAKSFQLNVIYCSTLSIPRCAS